MQATPLIEERMRLGESIIWDEQQNSLLWVDVGYPSYLYRYQPSDGTTNRIEFGFMLSGVTLTDKPDTVLLLSDEGLKLCHLPSRKFERFLDVEPDQPGNRCNDCGVDSQGRLWFGTMENNMNRDNSSRSIGKKGSLYCLSEGELIPHDTGIGIPNTLLWSPDNRVFYTADSIEQTIYCYQYDGTSLSARTIFSDARTDGVPDGSAIDLEGKIWNCRWGDAAVFVFASDGAQVETIPIPAAQVTSCTFAGPDMTTLYITTACFEMTPEEQEQYPLAGSVFKLETETRGTTRARVRIS